MLRGVRADRVDALWPTVGPMIQRAIDKSEGDYDLDDVLYHLTERDMQLWVWYTDTVITACAVTQIINYPQRSVCQVPFLSGVDYKIWIKANEEIGLWAVTQGCQQLEGFCRPGWLKILAHFNWRAVWTTTRKDL